MNKLFFQRLGARSLKVSFVFWTILSGISVMASLKIGKMSGPWIDPDWALFPVILAFLSLFVCISIFAGEFLVRYLSGRPTGSILRFLLGFVVPFVAVVWLDSVDSYFTSDGISSTNVFIGIFMGLIPGMANLYFGKIG